MTATALKIATTASALTLRPLLALLFQANHSVRVTIADFNRYMDAAHRVHDHASGATYKHEHP